MIPVSFPWFVAVYLALFLAGVLILWLGYEMMRRRQANHSARTRVFCRICGSRYTDTSSADLLECPVCGSRNERSV
jgi:rRNA maturation endonuclease Nob1